MITDVLYSVNMYILFFVKRFELSHVMDCAIEVLCIIIIKAQSYHMAKPKATIWLEDVYLVLG